VDHRNGRIEANHIVAILQLTKTGNGIAMVMLVFLD
jgi:hypothetical protein